MYYYNYRGANLVSLTPCEEFGPEVEPANSWRLFAAVPGDPVLGRGSFKVNHPGQLLDSHGLEVLDASRLMPLDSSGPCGEALMPPPDCRPIPLMVDETVGHRRGPAHRCQHQPPRLGGASDLVPPDGEKAG